MESNRDLYSRIGNYKVRLKKLELGFTLNPNLSPVYGVFRK